MPPGVTLKPLFFMEQEMEGVRSGSFGEGRFVLFTRSSPTKHSPNEDALGLVPYSGDSGALVVADGMGGQPGGRQASRTAVREVAKALERGAADGAEMRTAILNGFERANQSVLGMGSGGTTLAVAELSGRTVRSYHVGDSLILVTGQRGRVKMETIPHSPVGYAVESGILDQREAMVHEDRHLVTNAVGTIDMRIEIGPELTLAPKDTLLLASDGLSDNLYPSEIVELARKGRLDQVGQALTRACLARMAETGGEHPSKPDDLSFIVYRP